MTAFNGKAEGKPMNYQCEQNRDRARMVLRGFTGRGAMSVKELSQMSGITENQINADRDYLREGSIPFTRLSVYGQVFGAAFWAALIGPDGFAVLTVRPEVICPRHHLSEVLQFGGELSTALEDGVIDHRETRVLVPLARQRGEAHFRFAAHLERRVA
jgi:hypothetical protein